MIEGANRSGQKGRSAYIGLGSNLDSPVKQVMRAFAELGALPETSLLAVSRLYQSRPMGPADQPDYINAVAAIETALSPEALLRALQSIEQAHHRVRGERWGARTLDLDILLYADEVIETPELQVPHPGLHERNFVLYPLQEIVPNHFVIPGKGSISDWIARVSSEGLALYG